MRLKDEVAIITGSGSGIGRGIARILADEGAKIVVVDWDNDGGEKSAAAIRQVGGNAVFIRCDVSEEDQVKAMVQTTLNQCGRVDILVNNAGIGMFRSALDTSSADWDRCLNVNLKGVFLCSKYVIPHMQAVGKGSIVNISSIQTHGGIDNVASYAASKAGVVALTRSMAIDYGPTIRVNAIAPGYVLTPLTESVFDSKEEQDRDLGIVAGQLAMKRIGRPEDIGLAAAFLVSDEASYITGIQLFVDGGLTAKLSIS
ncbi:MAG: SDR family oxidoreductase [Ardenticatenia bacterium]|nr:SDR family oxidoreductase [Ardenticatenia bacterium]